MITNPNTLGLFDRADRARSPSWSTTAGGLVYLDGANMNAILGITRPGDFGADMMHFNPHKTFSGPHGGGGPGAGPDRRPRRARAVPARAVLVARATTVATASTTTAPSRSAACGASSATSACWCAPTPTSARTAPTACARVSENAVLNANYLLAPREAHSAVPHGDRCMHEFVASAAPLKSERGVSAMDIAKRLLDYGFHAPTVYFPLIVHEAMMIEPTETESKATLDALAEAFRSVAREAREQPGAAARGPGDAAGAAARRSAGRPPPRGEAAVPGRRGGRRLRPRLAPPAAARRVPAAPEAPP